MMHSASRRGVRDPTCAVSASSRGSRKAKAKATVYKGRPASIDAKRVRDLRSRRGSEHRRLRGALKIGRASVYRVLDATKFGVTTPDSLGG
jgi:hypothetical protein